ncbi:hypothetical protein GQ44DRAFT_832210 [Phaeosphaeriaceae sp. PMI808]|nr:hypothetical protein GQ44DRAFT_832210 [Phaeosphaeriaceae sp. PMI808]
MSHHTIPSFVSGAAISDHVYALPPNMAAQPGLVRFWCQPCLKGFVTTSKGAPDGSFESFVTVVRGDEHCRRAGNFGVCNSCSKAHKSGCTEVPPHFRRAVNVFEYLVASAIRDTNRAIANAGEGGDEATILDDPAIKARWQQAFDYVRKLASAFDPYAAQLVREEKKAGSDVDFAKARQVSAQHNLERYKLGLGPSGRAAPANVVVDALVEGNFARDGAANTREKRWYYYGNVPGVYHWPAI